MDLVYKGLFSDDVLLFPVSLTHFHVWLVLFLVFTSINAQRLNDSGMLIQRPTVVVRNSIFVPSIAFQRFWGGNGSTTAFSVAADSADNIYVAGATAGGYNPSAGGPTVAFLGKMNATGYPLWGWTWRANGQAYYGGSAAQAVAIDSSDRIYVTGFLSNGTWGRSGFLIQFNSTGSINWAKSWQGSGSESPSGITVGPLGDGYVAGITSSYTNSPSPFLLKFTENGSLTWFKIWQSWQYGQPLRVSIASDAFGNVYAVGSTASPSAAYLLKVNATGALRWGETWSGYGANSANSANGVEVDPAGNIFVTGSSRGYSNGSSYYGVPLLKFSPDGRLISVRIWEVNSNYAYGNDLTCDSSGGIYLTGNLESYSSGAKGILAAKFDPSGYLSWQATVGGSYRDDGNAIAVDHRGNAIVAGTVFTAPPYILQSLYDPVLLTTLSNQSVVGTLLTFPTTFTEMFGNFSTSRTLLDSTYESGGTGYLIEIEPPTPSAPSPPVALAAQSGTSSINLSWSAPQFYGGQPITGYHVYRGASGESMTLLADVPNVFRYDDTNARAGATYNYYVKAVNSLGESAPSNGVSAQLLGSVSTQLLEPISVGIVVAGIGLITIIEVRRRRNRFIRL